MHDQSRWRRCRRLTRLRHLAAGAFIIVFLTIQVVYPPLAWFSVDIARFSWHMYAGQSENPDFAVVIPG